MSRDKKPRYQTVDGFCIPEMFSSICFREGLQYKPRPDDLFIVTYPKCGTTWTQSILLHLFRKGEAVTGCGDFSRFSPQLEMAGTELLETMKRPGAIKSHLPFDLQPYSSDAKYIYVARNPKDCCVSFYHHTRSIPGYDFADGTFDEFFELFIRGQVDCGDYFDHVLSWYQHRKDPNVLFLTYEDMKKDTRGVIMQMAAFIGKEFEDMLKGDPAVMDNILRYSSFQYMKDAFNTAIGVLQWKLSNDEIDKLPLPKGTKHVMKFANKMNLLGEGKEIKFIRKGVVGDWRSHFSLEQSKRIDERFAETLGLTYLKDLWREHVEWH